MKVYFISGLAADSRVFKYIELPEGFEAAYLDWITPERNETLQQYAMRLAEGINKEEPFVVAGLSMGGMIATEIAKQFKPAATILISSIPTSAHLPGYFRIAAALRLHKIIPVGVIKTSAKLKRLITRETGEDKKMLRQIIDESDSSLVRWSMGAILQWRNEELPSSYIHIHGTRDEVLPLRYTKPTHVLQHAGHLLVMSEPAAINKIIGQYLSTVPA
jgi:pimeloyl-ACP methyl ester carboxylesterase